MILTDREIIELIKSKELTFNPPLDPDQVKASAIDLRLGNNFPVYRFDSSGLAESVRSIISMTVDLRDESKVVQFVNTLRKENNKNYSDGQPIELKPRTLLLAETLEDFRLPNNIAARIEGRSTYARLGIAVHQTAPSVKPGWSGQLTLEIVNNGPFTYNLYPKMKLCQLILERLGTSVLAPDKSTWQNLKPGN